ncbi:hypothetical protein FDT66_11925 [Polaribacter aestuariivivens]|uniref:DUF4890 domain-containing protein n=1 Tax=Polaribacter aestuariivivens TaxID=2304626 RepID=A0A5S3N6M4_9FLAO|nr:hypothetical protein [Polaribacter aestuariivivens]TMM29089.1 hypothetical protein FDT66_11925 [Polaribacter aestuariivivens]
MKKVIFTLILLVGFSTANFSQSKKMKEKVEEKATELVQKLDNQIKAGDKKLGLSDDQKAKIKAIQIERLMEIKKLGKNASKEDKKEVNKKHNQKIYKDILTKAQKKARKEGKEDE